MKKALNFAVICAAMFLSACGTVSLRQQAAAPVVELSRAASASTEAAAETKAKSSFGTMLAESLLARGYAVVSMAERVLKPKSVVAKESADIANKMSMASSATSTSPGVDFKGACVSATAQKSSDFSESLKIGKAKKAAPNPYGCDPTVTLLSLASR